MDKLKRIICVFVGHKWPVWTHGTKCIRCGQPYFDEDYLKYVDIKECGRVTIGDEVLLKSRENFGIRISILFGEIGEVQLTPVEKTDRMVAVYNEIAAAVTMET